MTKEEIAKKDIEARACIACKWCFHTQVEHICGNSNSLIFNPVEGHWFSFCRQMRGLSLPEPKRLCGPEGKWFEPKDSSDEK